MPFRNYSLTKNGQLTIGQILSPNYAAGVSGWEIRKDGSAEFNDLTIRGTFDGTDFVINTSGVFFYSGTPALGNLALSVTQHTGTDPFGNGYGSGFRLYGTGSAAMNMVLSSGGITPLLAMQPASLAHLTIAGALSNQAENGGLANEQQLVVLASGKEGNDDAALQLWSASADNTVAARAVFEFGGTVAYTITKTGPKLATVPVYSAACTSSLSVSSTNADIAGANTNVVVNGNTSKVIVTAEIDANTAAATSANVVVTLDWAGTTQAAQAVLVGNGIRATISQTWVLTGVTAGTYNAKLQATGTSGGTVRATHTSITAQVWEGS